MNCHSITDLPSAVFAEILLKLPVTSIVMCKSVCKAWYGLISDPRFANLHLARAKSCVLIRGVDYHKFSRTLYFMEPEDDDCGLYLGYCHCKARDERCECCRRSSVEVRFKLKIPLMSVQVMLDSVASCGDARNSGNESLIRLESREDCVYDVVNSCNGFLCLVERMIHLWALPRNVCKRSSVCICNPITGEFTHLPLPCVSSYGSDTELLTGYVSISDCGFGFGFSPKHNQYKVIRISTLSEITAIRGAVSMMAEIHTLGTDSWRRLDISGFDMPIENRPFYLNGTLYWTESWKFRHFVSFDLDDEQFHVHSTPLPSITRDTVCQLSIAVLGDRLFVYTSRSNARVDIWAANKHGISLSYTRLFSIDVTGLHDPPQCFYCQLVCCSNRGEIVLFSDRRGEFIGYDQSRGVRLKQAKFDGFESNLEIIAFTPNIVSLKDVATLGSNIVVLNVNSTFDSIF